MTDEPADNIVEIKNETPEQVFKILKDLMAEAERGNIQAIACAIVMSNASTGNAYYAEEYPIPLIGEMRSLESDIINIETDTRYSVKSED